MSEVAVRTYLIGARPGRRERRRRRRARLRPRFFLICALALAIYVIWGYIARTGDGDPPLSGDGAPSVASAPPGSPGAANRGRSAPVTPVSPRANRLSDRELRALRAELAARLGTGAPHYGVFVIDLISGRGTGVNENRFFPAASTVKLPLAMYVLDQAARGKINLDEEIQYSPDDYEEGTGVLQGLVDEQPAFQVRELVRLSLSHSDNIATNMLLRRFGYAPVTDHARRLGVEMHFAPEVNELTARGLAELLQRLMEPHKVAEQTRRFILDALANTDAAPRLGRDVPEAVAVPHKIGTLPGVVNDVGLILVPGRPVAVAVLSEEVTESVALQRIADIGRSAFAWAQRLAPKRP